jgi:hypothetical protein
MSPVKELRYFSGEAASENAAAIDGPVISDFSTYCEYFEGASDGQVAGEVSPSYMFYPGTAERIHQRLPNVHLIAILRDPVERAFSEYWHHWKIGRRLNGDFLRFVLTEDVEAEPRLDDYQDCVRRGLYYRQLEPYFRMFDREQLLILLYDDLKSAPASLMQCVYEFINVDSGYTPEVGQVHNRGMMPKKDWKYALGQVGEWWIECCPMEESTLMQYRRRIRRALNMEYRCIGKEQREKLSSLFYKDTKRLEELTGKNLKEWKLRYERST